MISIISNPNKKCGYRPDVNSTLTIYKKEVPIQHFSCYTKNQEEEENMSYICVYSDDNGAYIAADSLNVRYDMNGNIVERRKIQKIFCKDNVLIANCGLTTLDDCEVSDLIKKERFRTREDRDRFIIDIQKRLKKNNNNKIEKNIEIVFIIYDNTPGFSPNIFIFCHTISSKEIKTMLITKYQIAILGQRTELFSCIQYPDFEEEIERNPLEAMKKNVFYNIDVFVDTPVQLWKMGYDGNVKRID